MNKLGILTAVALFGFGSLAFAQAPNGDAPSVEEGAPASEATKDASTAAEEEEEKALEEDMEAASEKTAAFEEIEASPVTTLDASDDKMDNRPPQLRLAESGKDRNWGIAVSLDHALGTGVFAADDVLRGTNAFFGQSWGIRPMYKIKLLGHTLRLTGSIGFDVEFTTPNSNPARRFDFKDIGVSLSDPVLWTEPFTEIMFSAAIGVNFSTSYSSINVTERYVGMRLSAGAGRAIGPVYLRYGFGFSKNFNGSRLSQQVSDTGLRQTSLTGLPSVRGPGTFTEPGDFGVGFNTSFGVSNGVSATYNITEELSVTYAVSLINSFKYTASNVNVEDEFTSPYADGGRGRSDMLSPTLDVTYVLDGLIGKVYPLPFSVIASAGLTAMHPAQTENNDGIMWPFFYNVLGNRSTQNAASYYLSLTGSY